MHGCNHCICCICARAHTHRDLFVYYVKRRFKLVLPIYTNTMVMTGCIAGDKIIETFL